MILQALRDTAGDSTVQALNATFGKTPIVVDGTRVTDIGDFQDRYVPSGSELVLKPGLFSQAKTEQRALVIDYWECVPNNVCDEIESQCATNNDVVVITIIRPFEIAAHTSKGNHGNNLHG